MEDTQILNIWKSYGQRLNDQLELNRQQASDITRLKVQSFLFSIKPLKVFALLAGIVWVLVADALIIAVFPVAGPIFLVSAIVQVLLTKLAIGLYLYQLVLIQQADISEPVVDTQLRLARLRSSTLWVARLLFLQLPVWTTFYWNNSMLENGNVFLYILQGLTTLTATLLAVWIFFNIRYQNRDKKWFRLIFSGKEWNAVMQSIELLDDIKELKNEGE